MPEGNYDPQSESDQTLVRDDTEIVINSLRQVAWDNLVRQEHNLGTTATHTPLSLASAVPSLTDDGSRIAELTPSPSTPHNTMSFNPMQNLI